MRRVISTSPLVVILFLLINLSAQESANDPFAGNYELRNSKEIIFSGARDDYFTQRVFDCLNFPAIGDSVIGGPFDILSSDSLEVGRYNSNWSDMDAGNFFGDGSEEVVTAWKNQNEAISLLVSSIDPFSRQWHSEFYFEGDSGLLAIKWPASEFGCIRAVTGNFDQDAQDEFVLAYWGAALNTIKMVLYDADSTTNFQVKATIDDQPIYDEYLMVEAYQYPWFDLCAADLNNDGRDEIVLTGVEPAAPGWDAFIQIYNYDVDASGFEKQAKKVIFRSSEDSDFDTPYPIRVALGSGHFTDVDRMDCIVGIWAVDSSHAFDYDMDQNLIHIQIDSSLTEITHKRHFSKYIEEPEASMFGFASGDLNGNGIDYLLLLQRQHILIFRIQEDLTLEQLYDHNEHWHYYGFSQSSPHNLVIADIDTSLSYDKRSPEIIFYEWIYFPYYPYSKNRLSVFEAELDSAGSVLGFNLKGMKDNFRDDGFYPTLMTAANLDMDDIHLGTPKLFQKTDIV